MLSNVNNEKVWVITDLESRKLIATLLTTETPIVGSGIKLSRERTYNIVNVVYEVSTSLLPLEDVVENVEQLGYQRCIEDTSIRPKYIVKVVEREIKLF